MGDISKNFSRREFVCKCGCGFGVVDVELISVLEDIRENFGGRAVRITSGSRCAEHNRSEGGEIHSKHLVGIAADIVVEGISEVDVAYYLEKTYKGKYGIGRYKGRTHIDIRSTPARWTV